MLKLAHRKNKLITLALILFLPLVLTACTLGDLPVIGKFFGDKGGVSNQPANLTVWGLWENPEVVNVLVNKYKETHPEVTINYDDRSVLELVDYKERVFARANEQSGPDIMRVHVSWLPRLRGALAPAPAGLISTEEFVNDNYPVVVDNLVFNNELYGVPTYYDGLVLVYNQAHFDEIGQVSPPTAWEEFRRLALELTVRGENDELVRAGAAIGSASNIDFFPDIVGMLFSQAKVALPDELDTKPAQDALSFYTNFVLEDKVWSDALPEASAAFAQEKVSMIFVPVWNLLDILAARPDLKIGVAVPPQALPEEPATWGSFWVDVVPKGSANQAAAWEYIKFLGQAEQQLLAFNEASKYRSFGSPYSSVSLSVEAASNPYIKAALDTAPYAKSFEMSARAGNRRQTAVLQEGISNIIGAKADVSSVLTNLKTEYSQ